MSFSLKKYSELHKIIDGGMSEIFRTVELSTNREVVIKKMTLDLTQRSFSLKRFQNEAKNASLLTHNNIISIIDYGKAGNDYYIVMEKIDGSDLNQLMSDASFNPEIGLMVVFKALQALRFSHLNGIIHCDIKPSNLLIDKNGRVVLSDFGISQAKTHEIITHQGTKDFTTPLFMPPEQAKLIAEQAGLENDVWAETDSITYDEMSEDQSLALSKRGIQWDLWSVGVLLYRVCSGYYPFYENDFATLLTSIKHSDATDLHKIVTHLPHPIVAMIEQCLKKEPNERPLSLDPIIEVLQTYFNSRGISDIDNTISVYMNDKLQISPIPNDSTPVPDKKPSSNSLSTRKTESEWEFSEYKTIHFIPEPSTIQPSAEQQIPLLATEQNTNLTEQTAHNEGIQTKVLYSRFARPAIVVTTIAILVITSILLIKKHGDNLDFSSSSTDTNIKNSNGSQTTKSNLVVADSIIMPDQNSAVATSQVTETAFPDLLTKIDSSSALSITTNDSQTTRQLTTPPITIKQKKTTKPAGLTGILKVIINPLEANVFIDDTLLTQKDMEDGRPVSSGDHNITAKAAGYQKSERQILIESNKTLILELELKSEALGNGQLHIYSYPWANLYIDDTLIGTTPTPSPISLVEGSHKIVLKRDGFHPYNEFTIIKNGEVTRLQIQLEKAVEKEE